MKCGYEWCNNSYELDVAMFGADLRRCLPLLLSRANTRARVGNAFSFVDLSGFEWIEWGKQN